MSTIQAGSADQGETLNTRSGPVDLTGITLSKQHIRPKADTVDGRRRLAWDVKICSPDDPPKDLQAVQTALSMQLTEVWHNNADSLDQTNCHRFLGAADGDSDATVSMAAVLLTDQYWTFLKANQSALQRSTYRAGGRSQDGDDGQQSWLWNAIGWLTYHPPSQ